MCRNLARLYLSCALPVLLGTCFMTPVHAETYEYIAVTVMPQARKTGAVRAGTLLWRCEANRCSVSGPWPTPAVAACASLAREVGRLQSYGRSGAELNSNQLMQCNDGLAESSGPAKAVAAAKTQATLPGKKARVPNTRRSNSSVPVVETQLVAETFEPVRRQGSIDLNQPGGRHTVWSCLGSSCTMAGNSVTVASCFDLARQIGRIRSYRGPGGTLNSADLAICNGPGLESIEVTVRSGEDDLRQGSRLTLTVSARDDSSVRGWILFNKIEKHATASKLIPIADEDRYAATQLSIHGIDTLSLTFESGRGGMLDDPDNWDMVDLTVRTVKRDLDGRSTGKVVLQRHQNTPIKRFSHGEQWDVGIPLSEQ